MKNKSIFMFCCIALLGFGLFFIWRDKEKDAKQSTTSNSRPSKSQAITEKSILCVTTNAKPSYPAGADFQFKRQQMEEYFKELSIEGILKEKSKAGMISKNKAQDVACIHALLTSNTNKANVALIGDFYIVFFERHPNPFRVTHEADLDLKVGVDAWTGEYIAGLRSGGGVKRLNISRETGAGKVGESPEAEQYYNRTFEALKKLMLNVYYGRPWGDEPTAEMIGSEKAQELAQQQVANRKYDHSKEPLTLLIDDLYIVTFWDADIEHLPEGSDAYDSRVGIDAFTGEYIAMETTQEDRVPKQKEPK